MDGLDIKEPKLHLKVPFQSEEEAVIAYNSLVVDEEPPRSQVKKTLKQTENILFVELEGPEIRQIRHSINAFLDHLMLVQKTIQRFSLKKVVA